LPFKGQGSPLELYNEIFSGGPLRLRPTRREPRPSGRMLSAWLRSFLHRPPSLLSAWPALGVPNCGFPGCCETPSRGNPQNPFERTLRLPEALCAALVGEGRRWKPRTASVQSRLASRRKSTLLSLPLRNGQRNFRSPQERKGLSFLCRSVRHCRFRHRTLPVSVSGRGPCPGTGCRRATFSGTYPYPMPVRVTLRRISFKARRSGSVLGRNAVRLGGSGLSFRAGHIRFGLRRSGGGTMSRETDGWGNQKVAKPHIFG
jgi:hypothetical protein